MLFHIKRQKKKWSFLYQKDNLRTRNEGNVNPAQGKTYLQIGLKDRGGIFPSGQEMFFKWNLKVKY